MSAHAGQLALVDADEADRGVGLVAALGTAMVEAGRLVRGYGCELCGLLLGVVGVFRMVEDDSEHAELLDDAVLVAMSAAPVRPRQHRPR